MKGSFLLKISQREVFNELSNEEAGKLIKGIFNYVCDGESGLDGVLNAVFIPIKTDIDKNEEKYKAICERNKKNGLNGGRPKNEEEPKETQEKPVGYFGKNTHISYNHNSYNNINNNNIYNNPNTLNNNINSLNILSNSSNTKYINNTKNKLTNINNISIIEEIINYLNIKTNKKYLVDDNNTILINNLLDKGYTIDDFKKVIDNKTIDWIDDRKMNQYLRPNTLFGDKFDSYLNQKRVFSTNDIVKSMTTEELENFFW